MFTPTHTHTHARARARARGPDPQDDLVLGVFGRFRCILFAEQMDLFSQLSSVRLYMC